MLPAGPAAVLDHEGHAEFRLADCWASSRPSRSAEPPAENGTTIVTLRCGHSSWRAPGRPCRLRPQKPPSASKNRAASLSCLLVAG